MRTVAVIAGLMAGACIAQAQPSQPSEPSSPSEPGRVYEEVQQGVEDIGPLGESFEIPMADLRVPTGFERVYRAPGGGLMRISGAIHAVFPRSEYVATRYGVMPVVPAGAVFYLGEPRTWASDDRDAPAPARPTASGVASPLRIDNRVTARVAPAMAGGRRAPAPLRVDRETVMSDEAYRRERLATILEEALRRTEPAPAESVPPTAPETPPEAPPTQGG